MAHQLLVHICPMQPGVVVYITSAHLRQRQGQTDLYYRFEARQVYMTKLYLKTNKRINKVDLFGGMKIILIISQTKSSKIILIPANMKLKVQGGGSRLSGQLQTP